jgi:hypothetical protein
LFRVLKIDSRRCSAVGFETAGPRNSMKRTILLVALFCLASGLLFTQALASHPQVAGLPIDSLAVWNPSPHALSAIRGKCSGGPPAVINRCFISKMEKARASLQAIAFAKSFAATGLAYLRGFRKVGPVDIAYIEYAFRANELEGVLLVNGEPSIIDVDDQRFLAPESFSKNADYVALAKKYPQISVWPGDRFHMDKPSVQRLASGAPQFSVDYILRDGCHACAPIGTATLIFSFDLRGAFAGVQVQSVLARP